MQGREIHKRQLRTELPTLREQGTLLEKDLAGVRSAAHGLINEWATLASEPGARLLKEKVDGPDKRRGQIEESLASLEVAIDDFERDTVDQRTMMQALANFSDVFTELKSYQQRDLLRLILHKAILSPDYVKVTPYG